MAGYVGEISNYPGSRRVYFYDNEQSVNYDGDVIFSSSLVGSAICAVDYNNFGYTRRGDGNAYVNEAFILAPSSVVVPPPHRGFFNLDGTGYTIDIVLDGSHFTGGKIVRGIMVGGDHG